MTPTQRLAPMLRWAAECAERGWQYEAKHPSLAFVNTANDMAPVQFVEYEIEACTNSNDWDRFFSPEAFGPIRGWAYAIAYVLLTEEAGQ